MLHWEKLQSLGRKIWNQSLVCQTEEMVTDKLQGCGKGSSHEMPDRSDVTQITALFQVFWGAGRDLHTRVGE